MCNLGFRIFLSLQPILYQRRRINYFFVEIPHNYAMKNPIKMHTFKLYYKYRRFS